MFDLTPYSHRRPHRIIGCSLESNAQSYVIVLQHLKLLRDPRSDVTSRYILHSHLENNPEGTK